MRAPSPPPARHVRAAGRRAAGPRPTNTATQLPESKRNRARTLAALAARIAAGVRPAARFRRASARQSALGAGHAPVRAGPSPPSRDRLGTDSAPVPGPDRACSSSCSWSASRTASRHWAALGYETPAAVLAGVEASVPTKRPDCSSSAKLTEPLHDRAESARPYAVPGDARPTPARSGGGSKAAMAQPRLGPGCRWNGGGDLRHAGAADPSREDG